jgi:hypothetical protein
MAKFVEYNANRWITVLCVLGGAVLVPLVAEMLAIHEVISTTGCVVLVATGLLAAFLVNDRIQRRFRTVLDVPVGKQLKQAPARAKPSPRVFKEDPGRRIAAILIGGVILVLVPIWLRGAYPARGLWAAAGVFLAVCAAILILGAIWASANRVQIGADRVFIIYPHLARWRNRSFRFGDINLVEVKEVPKGGKEVRMILNDGRSVRYMTSQEAEIDQLVEVLKQGVARAKPGALDPDELA